MSTETTMFFALSLLALLVSVPWVHSDQSMLPLRSFKISGNVTYDCIDIYKQPGLDHPLLKNHTIQMKPSFSRHETRIKRTYTKGIECPYGTVPILRNTKEYISNAQLFSEKNVHPLTLDKPGVHIAAVQTSPGPYRGVEASLEGYNLNIGKDQISYTQVSIISSVVNDQFNIIEAGFMINPSAFGDARPWTYVSLMGSDGIRKECYKNPCPGFIQVSSQNPIVRPWTPGRLSFTIHQDKGSGNWWLKHQNNELGYWPKEFFNLLRDGANIVAVGGIVQASPSSPSPPMGNGNFPTGGGKQSAKFAINNVLNSNYVPSTFSIQIMTLDSPNCYGLKNAGKIGLGLIFNYGGPGGSFCGL